MKVLFYFCLLMGMNTAHAYDHKATTKAHYDPFVNQCLAHEHDLLHEMECKLEELQEKTFVVFDLNLSSKERSILVKLKLTDYKPYDRFGDFEKLKKELPKYFASVTDCNNGEIQTLTSLILRIAAAVTGSTHKETGWLTIRSSPKNNIFDLGRWHVDGPFFGDKPGVKFATALKGPQTLFYPLSKEERPVFKKYAEEAQAEFLLSLEGKDSKVPTQGRKTMREFLNPSKIVQANAVKGAFFIFGSENAAAHSEPVMTGDRIFLSIVPGSADEVKKRVQNISLENGG